MNQVSVGSRTLRVCHVMTADLWAGAEVQLATTVSYLVQRPELTVSAVLFNEGPLAEALRRLDVDVTVLDESRHTSARLLALLTQHLSERRLDLVHTHRYKDTVLGALAAKLAGVPHVVRTMHGLREPLTGWNHVKFSAYEVLDKAALRCFADRVIAVSAGMAGELRERGYRPDRIAEIHNGIDLSKVKSTRSAKAVRNALGLGGCTTLIGTAARLAPVKGHDSFLRAARLIYEREPGTRFVIVGDGPLGHELETLATRLRIDHACRFVGARNDVYDLISAMDIFVLPSLAEGMPMAILEAMALGTPVVATRVGGIPEVVGDRHTGLLVPPGDAEALSTACLELARDPDAARRLAAQGRRVVEEKFSREHNGQALLHTYRRVVRESGKRITAARLAAGLLRMLAASGTRTVRHAVERRQLNRLRRTPRALTSALRAGKHILVVCHGNIIRSPFAALLLAEQLGHQSQVSIASAGLEATPGRPPHPTALRTAAVHRVDLSSHTASRLDRALVARSDVIFVMEIPQLLALRRRFPEARDKTFLLSSLAPDTPLEIPDPILGDEPVFKACFEHITRAVRPLAGVLSQASQRT